MSEIGKQIVQAVRDAAAAKPDYVYQGMCRYVIDGCPACLVGQALWDLGLISADVESRAANNDGVDGLFDLLGIEVDPDEEDWLRLAQESQDAEHPWSEAVRWADEYDPEILETW